MFDFHAQALGPYSWAHVHAAMCIWEEMTTPQFGDKPWSDMLTDTGHAQMRDYVITILAPAAELAWTRAYNHFEKAYENWNTLRQTTAPALGQRAEYEAWMASNPPPDDPGSYDWEFIPMWLRHAVDWSGDQPRVRGTTTPSAVP